MFILRTAVVSMALLASVVFSSSTEAALRKRDRDTSFPACDTDPDSDRLYHGKGVSWKNTTDPVFYVASGRGSCGLVYTDDSNVACVHPGWVKSANINKCNAWVEVTFKGITSQARILDTCGAVANSTFDCGDMYLGKQVFEQLAGKDKETALANGRLDGSLSWRFIVEPCWGCYAGLPGITPDGKKDTCQGEDSYGFTRCGRKGGAQRIIGTASDKVCNKYVNTCPKV